MSGSLSFLQNLTQLQELNLRDTQASGSLSFLQNLTQLQVLRLSNTQVNGNVTMLPKLVSLWRFDVTDTQVGVPTQQQLITFQEQHPDCTCIGAFRISDLTAFTGS